MQKFFDLEIYGIKGFLNNQRLLKILSLLKENNILLNKVQPTEVSIYNGENYSSEFIELLATHDLQKHGIYLQNDSTYFIYKIGNKIFDIISISRISYFNLSSIISDVIPHLANSNMTILFLNDFLFHFKMTQDNPSIYNIYNLKVPEKIIKAVPPYLDTIDISKNVGKEHHFDEFDFYTTYKMWFGPVAINKFGRERILSFQEAEHLHELPNGLIEMQLCDHIDRCDSPENIRRQKALLNHLGIEHYPAEELKSPTSGRIGWLRKWLDK